MLIGSLNSYILKMNSSVLFVFENESEAAFRSVSTEVNTESSIGDMIFVRFHALGFKLFKNR